MPGLARGVAVAAAGGESFRDCLLKVGENRQTILSGKCRARPRATGPGLVAGGLRRRSVAGGPNVTSRQVDGPVKCGSEKSRDAHVLRFAPCRLAPALDVDDLWLALRGGDLRMYRYFEAVGAEPRVSSPRPRGRSGPWHAIAAAGDGVEHAARRIESPRGHRDPTISNTSSIAKHGPAKAQRVCREVAAAKRWNGFVDRRASARSAGASRGRRGRLASWQPPMLNRP